MSSVSTQSLCMLRAAPQWPGHGEVRGAGAQRAAQRGFLGRGSPETLFWELGGAGPRTGRKGDGEDEGVGAQRTVQRTGRKGDGEDEGVGAQRTVQRVCPGGAGSNPQLGTRVRQPHAPAGKVMVKSKVSVPSAPRMAFVQAAQ